MIKVSGGILAAGLVFAFAASAQAADPAVSCQSGKLKVAAKYGACRLGADAKSVLSLSSPDYTKCDSGFSDKWQGTETKAGLGVCLTEGDDGIVGTRIARHTEAISTLLAGADPVDAYSPATGQKTSYGAGSDGAVRAGAPLSYQDNGDGTITDLNTGLVWEKKVGGVGSQAYCTTETLTCANPHHASNSYSWSAVSPNYDGTAVTIFLNQLNNRCNADTTVACTGNADCAGPGGACGFAGHRDWRLPNLKELQGIINLERFDPAVDPAFHGANCGVACLNLADPACSCTQDSVFWSSSTFLDTQNEAWVEFFNSGASDVYNKTNHTFVRAVRSGF